MLADVTLDRARSRRSHRVTSPSRVVPTCAADLTTSWLTAVLGDDVVSFDLEEIGVGVGIFGEIVRVTPRGGPSLPASLIAKFPTAETGEPRRWRRPGPVRAGGEVLPRGCAPDTTPCPRVLLGRERRIHGRLRPAARGSRRVPDGGSGGRRHARRRQQHRRRPRWTAHRLVGHVPSCTCSRGCRRSCSPVYLAAVPPIYAAGLPVLERDSEDRVGADAVALARRIGGRFHDVARAHGRRRDDRPPRRCPPRQHLLRRCRGDLPRLPAHDPGSGPARRGLSHRDVDARSRTNACTGSGCCAGTTCGPRRGRGIRLRLVAVPQGLPREPAVPDGGSDVAHRDLRFRQRARRGDGRGVRGAHDAPRGRERGRAASS